MSDAAIRRSASRLVVANAVRSRLGDPGDRDVHQPDRTTAAGDRLKQARDEIAMHGVGVAAGAILEHAEAVHDDIHVMLAQQACQRGRVERRGSAARYPARSSSARATGCARRRPREIPRARRSSVTKRPIRPEAPSTKMVRWFIASLKTVLRSSARGSPSWRRSRGSRTRTSGGTGRNSAPAVRRAARRPCARDRASRSA